MAALADLVLVPRPQRLAATPEGCTADAPVRHAVDTSLRAEAFRLTIDGDGVRLDHADDAGRRYGEALLAQVRAQSGDPLPGLVVDDWPDLTERGFLLDVSRDRVPTRATLERLVDLLSLARYNRLQLYTEHTFAYAAHEAVWRDASPLTPDDVRWLDERCRAVGIELVPNQNCFAHMERWLRHDAYRARAEAPDGFDLLPGMHLPPATLAPTPDNAEFALGLLDELLGCFASRTVNIGCDEPFELGKGVSAAAVAERGKEEVYVEHVARLAGPLADRGYQVQIAADVLRNHPALYRRLPPETVLLAWTYEAPRPPGSSSVLPDAVAGPLAEAGIDLSSHEGFATNVAPLVEAGVPFVVLPGTSGWNSLIGRVDNALPNLVDAVETARRHGVDSCVVTDWGDNGHLQPPSVSFGPLVFGGAVAWALDANRDLDLPAVLDRHVFGDGASVLGASLDRLGRQWGRTGRSTFNASPLVAALLPRAGMLVTGRTDADAVRDVIAEIDDVLAELPRAAPTSEDGAVVVAELEAAARLARHGAVRMLDRAGGGPAPDPDDLAEAIALQESAWRARSRPGGLSDSLAPLRRLVADEQAAGAPTDR